MGARRTGLNGPIRASPSPVANEMDRELRCRSLMTRSAGVLFRPLSAGGAREHLVIADDDQRNLDAHKTAAP